MAILISMIPIAADLLEFHFLGLVLRKLVKRIFHLHDYSKTK